MKKILITGSSGFLGNNLTNYFYKKDKEKFQIFASYNFKKPKFPKKIKIIKLNSNVLNKKTKKLTKIKKCFSGGAESLENSYEPKIRS